MCARRFFSEKNKVLETAIFFWNVFKTAKKYWNRFFASPFKVNIFELSVLRNWRQFFLHTSIFYLFLNNFYQSYANFSINSSFLSCLKLYRIITTTNLSVDLIRNWGTHYSQSYCSLIAFRGNILNRIQIIFLLYSLN